MLTKKAQDEVEKLQSDIKTIDRESVSLRAEQAKAQSSLVYQTYRRAISKLADRHYNKEEKIRTITAEEISTGERNALKKETTDWSSKFVTIRSDKDIAGTTTEKVGWSKALQSFVHVSVHKYSSIMSNVKGCSSLTNKLSLQSFERIDKEKAETLLAGGMAKSCCFMGTSESSLIPITKTVNDLIN